jgi:hypothetical protein
MANPITLDELIRWRAQSIKSVDPTLVADSLSTELFPDDKVALHQVEALRKFRKLRQASRLKAAQKALYHKPSNGTNGHGPSARDELIHRLTPVLRLGSSPEAFVDALERLIDERLSQPSSRPPTTSAATWERNQRGSPFLWISRTPLVVECWVGPLVIGSVAATQRDSELYEGFFGTHGAKLGHGTLRLLEKLPGQHAIHVAKRRVEDRYRDWARNALLGGASV